MLLLHDDTESNPGLKKKEQTYFSLCHWNVNSLVAHKKTSSLAAYNSIYRYDIICISDSFLDSTISEDGNILHMEGYNLIRAENMRWRFQYYLNSIWSVYKWEHMHDHKICQ